MASNQIQIKDFQKGVAPSCYLGFQEMRCLDVTMRPGVVFPVYKTALDDSTGSPVIGTRLQGFTLDSNNDVWAHDYDGKHVYERTAAATWAARTKHSSSTIYNIVYWKGYVGVIFTDTIEWYHIDDSAIHKWTGQLTSGGNKPVIHSNDDKLYIGSGRYLDSIEEKSGQDFDPGVDTTTTCTVTKNCLDLPEGETINDILEIGSKLFLVCNKKIYPWDKSSASFDYPLNVNRTISQAIVYNNSIYFIVEATGEWFVTDGTNIQPVVKIPETMTGKGLNGLTITKPAIMNELIYFTVGYSSTSITPQGVYTLNPRTGAITCELITSAGDGSTYAVTFGPLFAASSSVLLIPSTSSTNYYIDYTNNSTKYKTDDAYFISQFYQLGTKNHKATITGLNINLTKPLVSSSTDSVKIWYRTAQNAAWTTYGNPWHTMSTNGLQTDWTAAIPDIENIQFKVVLNNNAELLSIIGDYINQ